VLTCIFVKANDTFSRNERIAALVVTILNTWWIALVWSANEAGKSKEETVDPTTTAIASSIFTALFTIPFTMLFESCSRLQCCKIEWGRFITFPLAALHLMLAIGLTVTESKVVPVSGVAFIGGLFTSWFVLKPFGIVTRTWLYGMGWKKWIGIGRKTKWFANTGLASLG